jgi:hypothetical protein
MALVFLKDQRLYLDHSHYCEHPEWVDEVSAADARRDDLLLYHCFWQGRLTAHHELSLRSLAATQTGPLEVWLWLTPGSAEENAAFLDALAMPSLRVKRLALPELAWGTLLQSRPDVLLGHPVQYTSDVVRTLVLAKHGGVYFDLDVLFLKDLRRLTAVEFFYGWSTQPYGNSALSHFRRESRNIQALLRRGASLGTYHPKHLYRFDFVQRTVDGVYVLPSFVFDPAWIPHDTGTTINDYCNTFDDFFRVERPMRMREFFPSSYTYHWHNRWELPLASNCIAAQIHREVSFASSRHP